MEVGFDIRILQVSQCAWKRRSERGRKGLQVADAIGSGRPEQSRIGGLEPDEGENA